MTASWPNDGTGWALRPPVTFPDEAMRQALIEQAPPLLPWAGSPRHVMVGREGQLGSAWADLRAREPSGRVGRIESTLVRHAEARRAVVAPGRTYAADLAGMAPAACERDGRGCSLRERGHDTLTSAVAAVEPEGAFDPEAFAVGVEERLSQGQLHLVLVLDAAPEERLQRVSSREVVSSRLVSDVVTGTSSDLSGAALLVPQRVAPARRPEASQVRRQPKRPGG